MADEWHNVGKLSDLDEDEPIAAKISGHNIGVHMVGNDIYAIDDVCPHAFVMLSDGFADGEELTCPKHLAVFHIPSGQCVKGPRRGEEPKLPSLAVHEVRIESGSVLVKLSNSEVQ